MGRSPPEPDHLQHRRIAAGGSERFSYHYAKLCGVAVLQGYYWRLGRMVSLGGAQHELRWRASLRLGLEAS